MKDNLLCHCFVTLHIEINLFANANICITSHIIVTWPKYKSIFIVPMPTTWCYYSSLVYIINGLSNNLDYLNHSKVICWVVPMSRNHIFASILNVWSTIANRFNGFVIELMWFNCVFLFDKLLDKPFQGYMLGCSNVKEPHICKYIKCLINNCK
jgi:hypothetical protein